MTLDQLMAFTVSPDHERQEHVWEALQRSYTKEPYQIRRMLTEGAVRASDKRARFVGIEPYQEAGGAVLRDLFQADDGGWLQDPALLDRLAAEKLEREAEAVRAEGWKWVEVATDFPYGHTYGLRRLAGEQRALTEEEAATEAALKAEYEQLEATYAEADELPEEADRRLAEIEAALEAFEQRPVIYVRSRGGRPCHRQRQQAPLDGRRDADILALDIALHHDRIGRRAAKQPRRQRQPSEEPAKVRQHEVIFPRRRCSSTIRANYAIAEVRGRRDSRRRSPQPSPSGAERDERVVSAI